MVGHCDGMTSGFQILSVFMIILRNFLAEYEVTSVLMYVPCISYSLVSRTTNTQQYIYINNILYTVITATCFDLRSKV